MATSIQMFGDKWEMFRDTDLIAVLCLLLREMESRTNERPALRPLMRTWKNDLAYYTPGAIDLKLNSYTNLRNVRLDLLSFIDIVEIRLEQFGEIVPGYVFDDCIVPGVKFNDYPSSAIMEAICRLRNLL